MKKVFAAILVIALLCSSLPVCAFAATDDIGITIVPNASSAYADVTMYFVGNTAYIALQCSSGSSSATYIQATSYIEKLMGSQYVRIPLENGQTEWTNTVSGKTMNLTVTQNVMTGTGQYRITTQYFIHNTNTGNQVKTATYVATYS